MPRKVEKLLDRARQTKAGWKSAELLTLYSGFGFTIREGSGSHKVISHPQFTHLRATVPDHPSNELSKKYIAVAVKNIEEAIRLEEANGEESDES